MSLAICARRPVALGYFRAPRLSDGEPEQFAMPKPAEVRSLFRAFLRQGKKFTNYNVREYTQRRARDGFRAAAAVTDVAQEQELWQKAQQELAVVKRQALVYSLYARKQRSVMDVPLVKVLEKQAAATAAD